MRIGAELRTSEQTESITSPFDGSVVGTVCVAGKDDVDDAIRLAHEAFEVTRRMPTHARVACLEAIATGIEDRGEELAELITRESGKPITYSRGEVRRAVITFSLAAAEARTQGGDTLPIDLDTGGEGRLCLFTRVPRGPVAAIAPFNFPLNLIAHKLAPAIAVGASVVLKPPPQCPLTGHVLGDIVAAAGWPDGGLSVVHCPPETAQQLVEDERIATLSFTGSDTVGWKLKSLAGKKQVLLELGGNAPCVLDAGVDLDAVMPSVVTGAWANAGQVCIKIQRVLVHASLFEAFLAKFVAATEALACGDPMDPATVVGPLVEPVHVKRIQDWVAEATAAGAVVHSGGRVEGSVVHPIILTGAPEDARVCRDEVFGPVTVVDSFGDFSEALARCNAGRFGLQAGIFTNDVAHAMQAYRELDYGGVLINDIPTFRVDNFPYGGTKDSGFGREGVRYAMEEMSEPKVLIMRGL